MDCEERVARRRRRRLYDRAPSLSRMSLSRALTLRRADSGTSDTRAAVPQHTSGASIARGAHHVRRRFHFTALLPEAFGSQPIFGGVNREATSTPTELATDVWGEWSLNNRFGAWSINPSVGAWYARYFARAWTESGAGSLSLSAPAFVGESLHADLGVRVGRTIGRFRPNVSVAYRRELTGRTALQ